MEQLLERYIYDVIRRLPQKERDEVKKELYANIYDMLPQDADADEEQVKEVLYQLGDPAILAEKYRQSPRYLISPRMYDSYIRIIKKVLPIIVGVFLCIGFVWGAIECMGAEVDGVEVSVFFSHAFSKGFEWGSSSVFYSLVWITVGFIIADRTMDEKIRQQSKWSLNDLPKVMPGEKEVFSLADCIAELVLTVIFSMAVILFCVHSFSSGFSLQYGSINIENIFTAEKIFNAPFIQILVPAVALMGLLGVFECIAKMICRRYTPLVLSAILVNNLGSMIIWIFLFTRNNIFASDIPALLSGNLVERIIKWVNSLPQGSMNPIATIFIVIVIVSSLAASAHAIYKTMKNKQL